MHLAEVGANAKPALPTRADESLIISVSSLTKDTTVLTAQVGGGDPRPTQPLHLGDTVQIDLWTISVTSICPDQKQVEFDVID